MAINLSPQVALHHCIPTAHTAAVYSNLDTLGVDMVDIVYTDTGQEAHYYAN